MSVMRSLTAVDPAMAEDSRHPADSVCMSQASRFPSKRGIGKGRVSRNVSVTFRITKESLFASSSLDTSPLCASILLKDQIVLCWMVMIKVIEKEKNSGSFSVAGYFGVWTSMSQIPSTTNLWALLFAL